RLIVSDIDGSILLAGDELRVPDVSGQVNGGTVTVVGALKREGVRLVSGRLAISGQGLAMAIPEALKTQANLELTLAVDRGSFSLSGDAVVLGGSYREPLSLTSGLLQSLTAQPSLVLPEERSAVDDIALDIRLT